MERIAKVATCASKENFPAETRGRRCFVPCSKGNNLPVAVPRLDHSHWSCPRRPALLLGEEFIIIVQPPNFLITIDPEREAMKGLTKGG